MSDVNSKRGDIATNRLLDLLRAQDAEKELRTKSQKESTQKPTPEKRPSKSNSHKPNGPVQAEAKDDKTENKSVLEKPVAAKERAAGQSPSIQQKDTVERVKNKSHEKQGLLAKLRLAKPQSSPDSAQMPRAAAPNVTPRPQKSASDGQDKTSVPTVVKRSVPSPPQPQPDQKPAAPSKLDELIATKKILIAAESAAKPAATPKVKAEPATSKISSHEPAAGSAPVPSKIHEQGISKIKSNIAAEENSSKSKSDAHELARIEEILNNIDQRPSVKIDDASVAPTEKSEAKSAPQKSEVKTAELQKAPVAAARAVPVKAAKEITPVKPQDEKITPSKPASPPQAKPVIAKPPEAEKSIEKKEADKMDNLEALLRDKLETEAPKPAPKVEAQREKPAKKPDQPKPEAPKSSEQKPKAVTSPEKSKIPGEAKTELAAAAPTAIETSSGKMRLSRIEGSHPAKLLTQKKGKAPAASKPETGRPAIQPGKPDALLKNTAVKSGQTAPKVVKPGAIGDEFFNTIPALEVKPGGSYFLTGIKNKFNESIHQISLYQDDNHLWLLQQTENRKGSEIQLFKEFSLPYHSGKLTIETMDQLIDHVLVNEIDSSASDAAYFAFVSSKHPTKTHIIQTPHLKPKDLNDLVAWHAKKNLPFSSDHAVINWEQIKSSEKTLKDDIVISAGEKSVIEKSLQQFEKHQLKLRYYSTIPVVMWKSFVQNYPDLNQGCYVLVHLGEVRTVVTVINSHKLAFSREIAIGAEELYKAVMKKVMTDDKSIEIDMPMARQLLKKYGFPQDRTGISENSHIDLYKISIFLRPVVERITSELNRSLNYFKKQNPDLNWEVMLFDGMASTFPNLLKTIQGNLNLKVGYFNPLRAGKYNYRDGNVIPESQLPNYVVNFALLSKNKEGLNNIPEKKRSDYKYIFRSKLMTGLAALLLPIFALSAFWMNLNSNSVSVRLNEKQVLAGQLKNQKNEMLVLQSDIKLIGDYYRLLDNDRTFTSYQKNILKLMSAIVPEEIKFTSLSFTKETHQAEDEAGVKHVTSVDDVLLINGFLISDVSLAHIQLTNFRLKLEQLPYFSSVNINMEDIPEKASDKFMFSLKLGI